MLFSVSCEPHSSVLCMHCSRPDTVVNSVFGRFDTLFRIRLLICFMCITCSRRFPINFHACFIHSTNIYRAPFLCTKLFYALFFGPLRAPSVMAHNNLCFIFGWNSGTNSPIYYGSGHRIIFHVSYSCCCRCLDAFRNSCYTLTSWPVDVGQTCISKWSITQTMQSFSSRYHLSILKYLKGKTPKQRTVCFSIYFFVQ